MSNLIKGGLDCPHCRHKNCYAEYLDGYHCFSEGRSYPKAQRIHRAVDTSINNFAAPPSSDPWSDKAKEYIEKYDIVIPQGLQKDIYYNDKLGRIIYTIHNPYDESEIMYWQARSVIGQEPKSYIKKCYGCKMLPTFIRHNTYDSKLVGYINNNLDHTIPIILVEDLLSALKICTALTCPKVFLPPYVVSLNGLSLPKHITIENKEVTIWFDGDEAGNNATYKLGKQLMAKNKSVKGVLLGKKQDPKETSYRDILEILEINTR